MRRDPRVLLTDIDQAGADIQLFIDGMDSAAYSSDARTQAAVERKFEIIGEVINRLNADHPDLAGRIPEMRRIIDFRNYLAHGYDHVAPRLVWLYATSSLPELRHVVQTLLAEIKSPDIDTQVSISRSDRAPGNNQESAGND